MPGATAAYGLRQLSSHYFGPLIGLTTHLSAEEFTVQADGGFPFAAVSAFAGASTIFVDTWYDQSGNGNDIAEITNSEQQPILNLGADGGYPSVQFVASVQTYLAGDFNWVFDGGSWTSETTLLGQTSDTGWYEPIFSYGDVTGDATNSSVGMLAAVGTTFDFGLACYGTNFDTMVATTTPVAFGASYNGSEWTADLNGALVYQPFSDQDVSTTTFVMGGSPAQSDVWLNGSIGDLILYPSALSSEDLATLQSADRAYYGF